MSETEKLIELVKQRSFLYDLCDPDYKNRPKRLETWNLIAAEMGTGDGNVWSNKWKGLRDNYAKYKKTSEPVFEKAYKKYKNWPWAEFMKFLDDYNSFGSRRQYCHINNTSSSVQTSPATEPKYCNLLYIPEINLNSTMEEMQDPVPEGTEHFFTENKKRKLINRAEEVDEPVEYLKYRREEQQPTLDGVDHFFLSYAQSFKKLPNRMQIMLKLEIATLFSRYELQAESASSESASNIPRIEAHPVKEEPEFRSTTDDES